MMNNLELLENIENLIKGGDLGQARDLLNSIQATDVSPIDLVYYCSLLRRVGLSLVVIKILQPLIYPKARSAVKATAEEKLEYASNLVRIGALNEAERLLDTIDPAKFAVVFIRKGFLLISKWDYEGANHCFKNYIENPHRLPYDTFIAQVNYLQGLVNLQKTAEAWPLAQSLLKTLDPIQHKLLLAAVYEFSAEIFRLKKNTQQALAYIDLGKKLLTDHKSIDAFLLRKQEQIILQNKAALLELREEAVQRKHYESIRDLDLHLALNTQNEKLINTVYWKTQSNFYRQRIIKLAEEYKINLNTKFYKLGKNKGTLFDLKSGALIGPAKKIKKDQSLSRLLKALLLEGYKPQKLIDLFSSVYANEIFFLESSPDKMHQLIKRLRKFISFANLPIEIQCKNEIYSVAVRGNFTLSAIHEFVESWQEALKHQVKGGYFDVAKARNIWNCSERTALRRLSLLKMNKLVMIYGKTRSTRFRYMG